MFKNTPIFMPKQHQIEKLMASWRGEYAMYKVEITETLQKTIEIDAEDEDATLMAAKRLYREEAVVLGSSDYIDTTIEVITL